MKIFVWLRWDVWWELQNWIERKVQRRRNKKAVKWLESEGGRKKLAAKFDAFREKRMGQIRAEALDEALVFPGQNPHEVAHRALLDATLRADETISCEFREKYDLSESQFEEVREGHHAE